MLPPLAPTKTVAAVVSPPKDYFDLTNAWVLAAVVGGILVLYSLSRIISLQRRIRDLEGRPPVDDIVMRGMIRHEVREIVEEQEEKKMAYESKFAPVPIVPVVSTPVPVVPNVPVPSVPPSSASPKDEPVFEIKFGPEEKLDSPLESEVQLSGDDEVKVVLPKNKAKSKVRT